MGYFRYVWHNQRVWHMDIYGLFTLEGWGISPEKTLAAGMQWFNGGISRCIFSQPNPATSRWWIEFVFFLNPEMAKSLVGEFAYNSPKGSTGIIPLLNVGIEYSVTEREAWWEKQTSSKAEELKWWLISNRKGRFSEVLQGSIHQYQLIFFHRNSSLLTIKLIKQW